ncbi:MAG: ABC transporter substrate-binding protein [Myxococcota bacterium]|jgi:phospholipid transport system substrate-binding protein|nr:ABC transporter substrate-binding protein [Myxococcota bacterium]
MKSRFLGVLVALLLSVSWAGFAHAESRPKPMDFVKAQHKSLMSILERKVSAENAAQRAADLRAVISALVDYDDLAIRSLGKHWDERTAEEKTEYQALFRELVELTYVDRLGSKNPDAEYKVDWDSEQVKGKFSHVICFVLYEDTETELEFVLVEKGESGYLMNNLLIDGASIEDTYHRKYSEQIEKEGYASLVAQMKERIAELKKKMP